MMMMGAPPNNTSSLRNPGSRNCITRQDVCDSLQVTKYYKFLKMMRGGGGGGGG